MRKALIGFAVVALVVLGTLAFIRKNVMQSDRARNELWAATDQIIRREGLSTGSERTEWTIQQIISSCNNRGARLTCAPGGESGSDYVVWITQYEVGIHTNYPTEYAELKVWITKDSQMILGNVRFLRLL